MLKLITISSSSKGNCHVLEDDNCSIMLDCGVDAKHILPNINISKLKGIFLSHKHSDHCKGCKNLNQYINAKFYCNEETYIAIPIRETSKVCIEEGKPIELCNFKIMSFEVYHDAQNFNYLIMHKPTGLKILYITDTSNVDNLHFKDIDIFIVEANWDEDWEVKEDDYVKYTRTSSELGHLSLQDTISFLKKNMNINTKKVFLTHISYESTDYISFEEKARNELNFSEIYAINPKVIQPREFILHEDLDFNFE